MSLFLAIIYFFDTFYDVNPGHARLTQRSAPHCPPQGELVNDLTQLRLRPMQLIDKYATCLKRSMLVRVVTHEPHWTHTSVASIFDRRHYSHIDRSLIWFRFYYLCHHFSFVFSGVWLSMTQINMREHSCHCSNTALTGCIFNGPFRYAHSHARHCSELSYLSTLA